MNRILHVDDEQDILDVARMALEALGGLTVETAGSGREALEIVDAFKPDLILLDVSMPGMDGPATFEALRRRPQSASVPVVFMTAKVQKEEVERYRKLGALDVIAKPFDPMSLVDKVRAIWEARAV